MEIETDFPKPTPSFQFPVPLIAPEPTDDPIVCVKINTSYIPYILGALGQLMEISTWLTDDPTARRTMFDKIEGLYYQFLTASPCETGGASVAGWSEDIMTMLRIACDSTGAHLEYQVCACPETWARLANESEIGGGGQPGGGSPQPPAGGGTVCYPAILNASSVWFLPTVLNTGDVVTITDGKGAVSNSHNINWRCISGSQFFGGACVGFPQTFSGDPVPSAPNGSLVIEIGGTFYSLESGPFTVPSGVVNSSATIQVNDAAITGLSGQFTFNVCVQNNAAAVWVHDADFTVSPDGWVPLNTGSGDRAVWSAGVGWIPNAAWNTHAIYIKHSAEVNMDVYRLTAYTDGTGASDQGFGYQSEPDNTVLAFQNGMAVGLNTLNATGHHLVHDIWAVMSDSSATNLALKAIHLEGSGTNPF